MSLTAAFTLMGNAGTSCVALNPAGFGDTFAPIAKFQWLYILFVFVTVAIGIMGVRAVVLLVKGKKNAYRYALITPRQAPRLVPSTSQSHVLYAAAP